MLIKPFALAYINWGRWVAECPAGCGFALVLSPGQSTLHCRECNSLTRVSWPFDADALMAALEVRPDKRNRNWFPVNHDLALRFNLPHGQSVAELHEETEAHSGVD